MKVENNKVVAISYALKAGKENEEETVVVENVDADEPFYFLFGNSGLPEGFENNLEGKNEGEEFEFRLTVEEGYGEPDEEAIVEIPKKAFEIEGAVDQDLLVEGNFLPMMDDRGYRIQGKVIKVLDDIVLMDFNHPLVGFELYFSGKVEKIREATSTEIEHGHVHGEGGHHH
jgi:FKBP-type peptidyl-prolyl cis-trans isomerase SlyD